MRSPLRVRSALCCSALLATTLVAAPAVAQTAGPIAPGKGAAQTALDGDPATTERLFPRHATHAAIEASRARFAGTRTAAWAVLARDDTFPDSLAGSALTGKGPLLYTRTAALTPATAAELDRVLDAGDTVYLLGGPRAISTGVEDAVRARGYRPVRLAGQDRVGTSLAVAKEVRRLTGRTEVILARAFGTAKDTTAGWADSVAGGAIAASAGVPVVVTPSDRLAPAVDAWLDANGTTRTVLLGGTAALSNAVQRAVPNPVRIAGADRAATAAAIAAQLWKAPTEGPRRFVAVNGRHEQGWAYGFAAAGVAADAEAPVLLVDDGVSPATAGAASTCGEPEVDLLVVGDGSVVSPRVRERLDAFDGAACGTGGAVVVAASLKSTEECPDLLAYFQEHALERVGPWGLDGGPWMPLVGSPEEGTAGGGDGAARDEASAAPTSGTNTQEEGVDEPDIVKSDGRIALAVAHGVIQVIDVADGSPDVLTTIDVEQGWNSELLLEGSRLLVLTRTYEGGGEPMPVDDVITVEEPVTASDVRMIGSPRTVLTTYDLSTPSSPRRLEQLTVDGDYRSARLIGGTARIVLTSGPRDLAFTFPEDDSPEAQEAAAEHNRQVIRDSTLDNWLPDYTAEDSAGVATEGDLVPCAAVRTPPWFGGLNALAVIAVDIAGGLTPTSAAAVVADGDTVYASPTDLVVATSRWNGWEAGLDGTAVTTELHDFDISEPNATTYVASGSVRGYLLNQFSLSESGGYLRVATTEEAPWELAEDQPSESAVRVLAVNGDRLEQVGALGGLGVGERIYAVRFMGDLAAVVTFRQVDPLYLIDLSDPRSPRLLGELKVPGYSAYLHRIDEHHLLGVGQNATEEGRVTGTQVSLFDITDRGAPIREANVDFPDSYSEVEWDHHAFLYWNGLAVVPISEYTEAGIGFNGAVGLRVGADSLTEAGRVEHPSETEEERWQAQVRRSFVVGDVLFTVSELGIAASDLTTLQRTAFARF